VPGYLDQAFSEAKGELDALLDESACFSTGAVRRIFPTIFVRYCEPRPATIAAIATIGRKRGRR